jgi:hypothetical protein
MDSHPTATTNDVPSIAYRPRRRADKQATRPGRPSKPAPTKRPVKLMIDVDAHELMVVHALRRGENLSELVVNLVRTHLNDFVVHRKPGPQSEGA